MKNNVTCCLPWNHLATHPNGAVSLCCQAKLDDASGFASTNSKILKLDYNSVIDIINSDTFIDTRKKMIEGIKPETCSRCYAAEDKNEWSKRIFENKRFNWNPLDLKEKVLEGELEFIELRLGNVCNLACATCNSISSSKWIRDEKKLAEKMSWYKDITYIETNNYKWFENEKFYEDLAEKNPSLKKIYINGGEPFLIKAHKRLLEKLIELKRAGEISLEYSTNVTIIPSDYIELFKNFNKVTVMLSVDDIGLRNDWLRWPSSWENINNNIDWYLMNSLSNMDLILCQTVSCLNVFYVDQMIKYCTERNIAYTSNFVFHPKIFSASSLDNDKKERIKKNLDGTNLSQLNSWLSIPYDKASKNKLNDFLNNLDELRNIDSRIFIDYYQ